jgi:5-epi-alpha-selinene synthase
MANNLISWCNDLVSLEKEMRVGDVHNLVVVLQHHHQISLQQAIHMAIEQHNAEMKAYLELEPQVPSFGPDIDPQVQLYLRGLRHWMRGNLDWGLTAKRYMFKTARETK